MSPAKFTRTIRLTSLVCGGFALTWLGVGCGNTDDVPGGYDMAGASSSGASSGGRAGGNGAHAGATNGHAGASGAQSGAGNPGGGSGESGAPGSAGMGSSRAGMGGASAGQGAGMGGASAGQGAGGNGGVGGARAGAGGASAGQSAGGASAGQSAGGASAGQSAGGTAGNGGAHAGTAGSLGGGGSNAAGSAGTSGSSGTAGTAGVGELCGNGVKDGAEQCDDAVSPSTVSTSPKCSNTCTSISTQACVDCENAGDCYESVDNCSGVALPFAAPEQKKCFDVLGCIQASNCFDGTGTLGKCYCGTLSTTDCGAAPFTGAGSPNGACVAQIKAGFPTFTKNSEVLAGLTASDFPSGAAMKRLSCQKGANQSACLGVCGFTAGGPAFP